MISTFTAEASDKESSNQMLKPQVFRILRAESTSYTFCASTLR